MFEDFVIERYKDGPIIFKDLENRDCIKVYDKDLSGSYYVDITLQALVFSCQYRKWEFKNEIGCRVWYSAIEPSIISFKCDTFPTLKDKTEEVMQDIIFQKWRSILHMAISGDPKDIKFSQQPIVIKAELTDDFLHKFDCFLNEKNIFQMPYYYSESKNSPYQKRGQISIDKVISQVEDLSRKRLLD